MQAFLTWMLTEVQPGWHPINPTFLLGVSLVVLTAWGVG